MNHKELSPAKEDKGLKIVLEAADRKKGQDLIVLDLRNFSDLFSYFVIVSGLTKEHTRVIADEIIKDMEDKGFYLHHMEGYEYGRWILLDFDYIVVHVFIPQIRSFYSLENLWGDAPSWKYENGSFKEKA